MADSFMAELCRHQKSVIALRDVFARGSCGFRETKPKKRSIGIKSLSGSYPDRAGYSAFLFILMKRNSYMHSYRILVRLGNGSIERIVVEARIRINAIEIAKASTGGKVLGCQRLS
jgi:hypothetical protein